MSINFSQARAAAQKQTFSCQVLEAVKELGFYTLRLPPPSGNSAPVKFAVMKSMFLPTVAVGVGVKTTGNYAVQAPVRIPHKEVQGRVDIPPHPLSSLVRAEPVITVVAIGIDCRPVKYKDGRSIPVAPSYAFWRAPASVSQIFAICDKKNRDTLDTVALELMRSGPKSPITGDIIQFGGMIDPVKMLSKLETIQFGRYNQPTLLDRWNTLEKLFHQAFDRPIVDPEDIEALARSHHKVAKQTGISMDERQYATILSGNYTIADVGDDLFPAEAESQGDDLILESSSTAEDEVLELDLDEIESGADTDHY